jgi:hypothetical protein
MDEGELARVVDDVDPSQLTHGAQRRVGAGPAQRHSPTQVSPVAEDRDRFGDPSGGRIEARDPRLD